MRLTELELAPVHANDVSWVLVREILKAQRLRLVTLLVELRRSYCWPGGVENTNSPNYRMADVSPFRWLMFSISRRM